MFRDWRAGRPAVTRTWPACQRKCSGPYGALPRRAAPWHGPESTFPAMERRSSSCPIPARRSRTKRRVGAFASTFDIQGPALRPAERELVLSLQRRHSPQSTESSRERTQTAGAQLAPSDFGVLTAAVISSVESPESASRHSGQRTGPACTPLCIT
jgi:hypothetical protein